MLARRYGTSGRPGEASGWSTSPEEPADGPWGRFRRRARSAAKSLLETLNRALHPLWRRRARRRLREAGVPARVLFVCHGNICRSPYAEGALRRELPPGLRDAIEVDSVGFVQPDRPSPSTAVTVAGERAVDLSRHRSRLIDPDSVRSADLVFVMERGQKSALEGRFPAARVLLLGDLDPERADRRRILDPVAQDADVFRRVYDRIDRCVEDLATYFVEAPRGVRA